MILLTDNDILIKLAQCDLVEEALSVFRCGISDLYILQTAKHSLFLSDADKCIAKRVGNARAYDRLCDFVDGCSELGAAEEDIGFLEELSQMENIDPGEEQLLLHAYGLHRKGEPFSLTTGDRKALEGILNSDSVSAKQMLQQRVECTESILLKAMQIHGFDPINYKVSNAMSVTQRFDSVLRMSFGNGRDYQHALSCLNSYLQPVAQFIRP